MAEEEEEEVSLVICKMYVCMYAYPLWKCPWNRAVQLGLGERPINKVGPISQSRSIIDTASHTLIRTNALCVFRINFTLGS